MNWRVRNRADDEIEGLPPRDFDPVSPREAACQREGRALLEGGRCCEKLTVVLARLRKERPAQPMARERPPSCAKMS